MAFEALVLQFLEGQSEDDLQEYLGGCTSFHPRRARDGLRLQEYISVTASGYSEYISAGACVTASGYRNTLVQELV